MSPPPLFLQHTIHCLTHLAINLGDRAFSTASLWPWNSLPVSLREASLLTTFRVDSWWHDCTDRDSATT